MNPRKFLNPWWTQLHGWLLFAVLAAPLTRADSSLFREGDIVAFVGGGDVVGMMHTGHLEALLAVQHSPLGLRFRNFGWEGDTVFEQPRDFGFPPTKAHLERAGVAVLFLCFGRGEALDGSRGLPEFIRAYEAFIEDLGPVVQRIVLVTPVPFEQGGGALPNLAARNGELRGYAEAIRQLAAQKKLRCIDLFEQLSQRDRSRLTENGLQITAKGHAQIAAALIEPASDLLAAVARAAGPDGAWPDPEWEALRQAVIEKNLLWFHYWRPQNWAFLGGDRIEQPSSRDHRDRNIRWFPEEMKKFMPLIEAREKEIAARAAKLAGGAK